MFLIFDNFVMDGRDGSRYVQHVWLNMGTTKGGPQARNSIKPKQSTISAVAEFLTQLNTKVYKTTSQISKTTQL